MASNPPLSAPPLRYGGIIGSGEYNAQGMISPANAFVEPDGAPTAVSFRFLHSMFNCIQHLESEVATLQQRLANAGIP